MFNEKSSEKEYLIMVAFKCPRTFSSQKLVRVKKKITMDSKQIHMVVASKSQDKLHKARSRHRATRRTQPSHNTRQCPAPITWKQEQRARNGKPYMPKPHTVGLETNIKQNN